MALLLAALLIVCGIWNKIVIGKDAQNNLFLAIFKCNLFIEYINNELGVLIYVMLVVGGGSVFMWS